MKKIILILIDSLMSEHLEMAINSEKVPAIKYLIDNGIFNKECVTSFPTMTASIDASLLTGVYPDQHKIPGLIWYSNKDSRIVDYINGTKTVLRIGLNSSIKDALININEFHLSRHVKTIYEELNDKKKTAASINFLIHRGREKHEPDFPFFLKLVTKYALNKTKMAHYESNLKSSSH